MIGSRLIIYGCRAFNKWSVESACCSLTFALTTLTLQHRDHVTSLPRDTLLIGSTPKCPIQGFIRYRSPSSKDIHILALQGHPEFVPDIVEKIIDVRAEKGVLDEPTTVEARRRARGEMRGRAGLEGRGIVGWAVMQVLLK